MFHRWASIQERVVKTCANSHSTVRDALPNNEGHPAKSTARTGAKNMLTKKQQLYGKRRTAGLCPQCGRELIKSSDRRGEYCDHCATKFNRYYKEKRG